MKRRDFIKYSMGGLATIVVGTKIPWLMNNPAYAAAQVQTLSFTITDAVKEMVTHEPGNNEATCYFWIYQPNIPNFPPECPGPTIFCTVGDTIEISITNALDEPHSLFINQVFDSGPIDPGATVTKTFQPSRAGTYLYYDNLNEPVNRVMGLHGAFIVMPPNLQGTRKLGAHRMTPYDLPTPTVQLLFDDLGTAPWWPGLAWEQGDAAEFSFAPPFRQYIWLNHQASPNLFAEVGSNATISFTNQQGIPISGPARDPAIFIEAFVNDAFVATSNDPRVSPALTPVNDTFNRKPHFFTINGQSGHFAHNHPATTPMLRVGEPCLVRVLNAGLWTHSMHLHANHFFLTCFNGKVQANLLWLDTFTSRPMDTYDMVVPFMRPPDIPNIRGIGRPDQGRITSTGQPAWPPIQEFSVFQPKIGTEKDSFLDANIKVDIAQRQSPLVYPMHDHSEASQGAQGGNYNCGLIAGMTIIGDRNTSGWMNFPWDEDWAETLALGNGAPVTKSACGDPPPLI